MQEIAKVEDDNVLHLPTPDTVEDFPITSVTIPAGTLAWNLNTDQQMFTATSYSHRNCFFWLSI